MAEANPSALAALKSSHRTVAVGLHEAALDSPTFRATAAHFADQIDAVERWLNGYVNSTDKLLKGVIELEGVIQAFLKKTVPSQDGVIENDYAFLSLKRVGDGSRDFWMQLLNSSKQMEASVVEPVKSFLHGDMRNFKEIRKALEQSQRAFDSTLARYVSQSKTKEPSHLREDAFSVYETRKTYLQASMDYCQLAPQVRFTMDQLLVKVSGEMWKELKRSMDATSASSRWDQEMERIRGWSKSMEDSENIFRRELQIARRDLGDAALIGCKPSRELEDYSTSTVPFLGSRGPMNMRIRDEGAVISEKQGWLYLRQLSGKPARHNWVRRWYYCRDRVFGWLIPGPQGVVQGDEIGVLLCNAKPAAGEDRRFCFEVKTKNQTLLLQAETQGELTEWLEVFEVTKKKAFEATADRDAIAGGAYDPAFSISPPSIPEFSARTLDTHLGLASEEPVAAVERAGTLPVPNSDGHLAPRQSFDPNGSMGRRSITALGRDLAREEGESGREHAARIIQKLDLHRKATFGTGAEAALGSSQGSAGGLASLISASHTLLPGQPNAAMNMRQGTGSLPSLDTQVGTLAPLTLAPAPAVTNLSRTAVLTAGQRDINSQHMKLPPSVLANYWGSSAWGSMNEAPPDPVLPRLSDDDPVGVVVSPENQATTPLAESMQQKRPGDTLPRNYPPELRAQHGQFRLLFPNAPLEEKLVLVFRAAWASTPLEEDSSTQALAGDGRVFVTPDHMYFYGQQMGLVTAYTLSLDMISEVTATPGKENDHIILHLGQDTNDTGYSQITITIFLDDLRVLHTRLNLLIDDLQAEVPMDPETLVSTLLNVERNDFDKPSPTVDSWEEVSVNTPQDDGTPGGRTLGERPYKERVPKLSTPLPRLTVTSKHVPHIPSHPVVFEPEDMRELAAERHLEISAKSCFHVLFGDKSFVFPKLYFEHRAQQIAQGPWIFADKGLMRREYQFKVDHTDLLGRRKVMDVTDYQTIETLSEHITYVVTHVKTAWHLPHSQHFKLITKVVITFVAKTKCKLAIYVRVDWSKTPALAKNLVERQALRDVASNAEELAELATDQVRKLGARSRTNRAIQVYGHVGHQTQVVIFSPAANDSSRRQAVKLRTLTTLIWETVRSFGESAISSLIMWAFAGVKKLFEVLTAQRLLLLLLGLSTLTNMFLTSNKTSSWWKERRAANFMRQLGVGPNTMMSKAIYMADLSEASDSSRQLAFPQDSACFSSFQEVLNATDMDAPWEEAGSSFSTPSTRSTATRLRRTRQRLGTYRHDLVVAMRVVNSIEREMLQSEWENWLMNEVSLCDDLAIVLKSDKAKKKEMINDGKAQKVLQSMPSGKREALVEWHRKHCGSCRADYEGVMSERKVTGF